MQTNDDSILRSFNVGKVFLPILLGLGVATILFIKDFDRAAFEAVNWTWFSTWWIFLALLSVCVRDLFYMIRIRILTDNHLSWRNSFNVIMLWEFASAIVPGMLGSGFFFAIFILNREKINMGKSITAIMFSSFLDGVFLAVMAPLLYFTIGKSALFNSVISNNQQMTLSFGAGFFYTFWSVYFIILAYKLFVAYALFVNPHFVKHILVKTFSLPLLKRWKENAVETGEQLLIASKGLQDKTFNYWMGALFTTFVTWTARYSIVNCILNAFSPVELDHLVIYARQVIMGIIVLFSPTPGGSGIAEYIFTKFLSDFIGVGLAPSLALLWRLLSYYPYLIIGAIILPRWVRRRVMKHQHTK
ncbi:MAG: flippase-like domain-containing protein [Bacteroidetes bacterium]|nr:flippase-like domain-containing protein [Bacteroidota bacterium]